MSDFSNFRLPGVAPHSPVMNLHKKVILEDRHTVIEILIGNYTHEGTTYCVAGYHIINGEQTETIDPKPDNGLYRFERQAIIFMVRHLRNKFKDVFNAETLKVLQLAETQYRQVPMFDFE